LPLDVTDRASVENAVATVIARTGRIDVLVNNAAIFNVGPVEAHDDDELLAAFETNVLGVIRVTRAALPRMRAQERGTVVVVGSIAGRVAWPPVGVYAATKAALEALSDTLYYELHPFRIRVVLVEPGHFATGLPARLARHGPAGVPSAARPGRPGPGLRAGRYRPSDGRGRGGGGEVHGARAGGAERLIPTKRRRGGWGEGGGSRDNRKSTRMNPSHAA